MSEAWAPTLSDVGKVVSRRTRDTRTRGSDALLGTFTANTTPTDEQVQARIDDVVSSTLARVGDMPSVPGDVATAARMYVELRVGADIELAYANREADLSVYRDLSARADDAWKALQEAMKGSGGGSVEQFPEFAYPAAPWWGDTSPGSGTDWPAQVRHPWL